MYEVEIRSLFLIEEFLIQGSSCYVASFAVCWIAMKSLPRYEKNIILSSEHSFLKVGDDTVLRIWARNYEWKGIVIRVFYCGWYSSDAVNDLPKYIGIGIGFSGDSDAGCYTSRRVVVEVGGCEVRRTRYLIASQLPNKALPSLHFNMFTAWR